MFIDSRIYLQKIFYFKTFNDLNHGIQNENFKF